MQTDFLDAHERHLDDADFLFSNSRWANADHLYGMAAECGLKRMMAAFGMNVNSKTGSPADRNDWVHADKIWMRYESYRQGRFSGANYSLPKGNPFFDWDVSQRYAHRKDFNQSRAQAHQQGAQIVRSLVQNASLGGILP